MRLLSGNPLLLCLIPLLIGGCSLFDGGNKIYYANGKEAHVISCTGSTWSGCLQSAGKVCREQGYEILEKSSGRENGFFYDSNVKELVISCNVAQVAPTVLPLTAVAVEEATKGSDVKNEKSTPITPAPEMSPTKAEAKDEKLSAPATVPEPSSSGAAIK